VPLQDQVPLEVPKRGRLRGRLPAERRRRSDLEEVIMSKVILDINMSLDGLIAQP
jgi:hypothetical protein